MTDEEFKKITQLISKELRPLKELVEISNNKVDKQEIYMRGISSSVKLMREQQSVMNAKIDSINKNTDEKITASEKIIIDKIGEFINKSILPQFDDKADQATVDRIERKLDLFADRASSHDKQIKEIQSLPTVVHELKVSKSKAGKN